MFEALSRFVKKVDLVVDIDVHGRWTNVWDRNDVTLGMKGNNELFWRRHKGTNGLKKQVRSSCLRTIPFLWR